MNILVTGGAGFIGSHTADAALRAGHTVRVLDDLSTGTTANLPAGIDLHVGNIVDGPAVERALHGCDAVIHLAALVSVPQSLQEPVRTYAVNTTGTVTLLEAARQAGVRRVVLASTCAVYGDLPGRKTEASPVLPLVPYAASKRMAEQWLQLYAVAYGMETVVLRYFNVYGPRQRADSPYSGVIARWCDAALGGQPCRVFGDGNQTRDFISVHDVAQANLLAATHGALAWGEIYQVATGQSTTLNGVLDALAGVSPRPLQRRHEAPRAGDIIHSAGSSDKLQRLGWQPVTALSAGLAELLRVAAGEGGEGRVARGAS